MRTVQLFVSSPGDVEHERRRVDRVAERLNGELAGVARIETIRREASSYGAHGDLQGQAPEAADCDIVLAILWSSLGSELPTQFPRMPGGEPYPSAAGYEVLSAIRARTSKQRPDVFVFRKTERPRFAIDDAAGLDHALMQWTRLQTFFERWFVTPQGRAAFTGFATTDEFESKIEALLREWLEAHVLHGRSVVWPIAIKGSPFRGLAPFEAEHAPVFFGRARDVARAIDRFKAAAERGTPFLLVVGASGAGKSSLVRAGLASPADRAGGGRARRCLACCPDAAGAEADRGVGRNAVRSRGCRRHGRSCADAGVARARRRRPQDAGRAGRVSAPRRRSSCASDPGCARSHRPSKIRGAAVSSSSLRADLLLVVDQLDELFAADVSAADRAGFAKAAARARRERAEYGWWPRCARRSTSMFLGESDLEALKAAGADYDLAPPGPAELAEIVRKPAEAAGLVYETNAAGERLDDRLLRDAAGVDTLPPLQFTLQRLFAERQIVGPERRLAFAAYGAVGGVGGAIDLAAERALAGLGEAEVGALPRLLRQLAIPVHQAAPNDAGRPLLTIRAATLLEAATDAAACRLVDALVEARILLHAKERGVSTIRIAHDRVLESWQRARAIVAGDLPRVGDEARGPAAASGTSKRQWLPTAAAVALAVVAAIASWQYFEARAAKRTAEQAEMAALAERDRAARERQLAEDERKQSEEQRDIAQKRQEKAEEQRQLAQDRQKEAEEQRGIAHQLKEAAEAHRLLAEVRRKEADDAAQPGTHGPVALPGRPRGPKAQIKR